MGLNPRNNEDVRRAKRKFLMIRDDAVKPEDQKRMFNEVLRKKR